MSNTFLTHSQLSLSIGFTSSASPARETPALSHKSGLFPLFPPLHGITFYKSPTPKTPKIIIFADARSQKAPKLRSSSLANNIVARTECYPVALETSRLVSSSTRNDMNFISNQHLGVCTVPSTVARGTEHESARRVDVQTRNDTRSGGSGDNEEGNG